MKIFALKGNFKKSAIKVNKGALLEYEALKQNDLGNKTKYYFR